MNFKLNIICFILLLFLLVGVCNAADSDNETVHIKQQVPDVNVSDTISANINDVKLKATVNKEVYTATSSKLKVNLKASNVKMYYGDGSKFKVTLKDNKKKVMKNTKLNIVINGKSYTKTTDSKGIASVKLNLNSGTYNIVTTYAGSSKFAKQSIKNTLTVKSTIKANDLSKYYKNKGVYTAKFYDTNGKVLKKATVKYSILNTVKTIKTDSKGVVKINIDLKPGQYQIALGNTKSNEIVKNVITIKNTIEHNSFTSDSNGNTKYSVKIFNSNGKAYPNQKVSFKVDNKLYTNKSDKNGIATIQVKLNEGKHNILTEYNSIKITYSFTLAKTTNNNNIKEEETVKETNFTHTTLIPNYVNVTNDYVFKDTAYALKTGFNGIIKMPKNDIITVQIVDKSYLFSTNYLSEVNTNVLNYNSFLVPFDGSPIESEFKKENFKKDGIILSRNEDYTEIEYKSTTEHNTDLFGVYMGKGFDSSETITYIQNNKIKAMVNFFTDSYDETGVRYNIAKFYGKTIYEFDYKNYKTITDYNENSIKYVKTNEPVAFSYFGNYITGTPSREDIITKFSINNVEELEKEEIISYGKSEKYVLSAGFEVLQSYAIVNEKIIDKNIIDWLNRNSSYISKTGISNMYGMFITALETCWIADKLADKYAKDLNVTWMRNKTVTILGGINLNSTYIHVLNADMGMDVVGKNALVFKMINGLDLPSIEDYSLSAISEQFNETSTNSIEEVLTSLGENKFSIVQLGDIFYIFSENGKNSTIIINSTSGVVEVIMLDDNFAYKGAKLNTVCDCCSISGLIRIQLQNARNMISTAYNTCNYLNKKGFPLGVIGHHIASLATGVAGSISEGATVMGVATFFSIVGTMFAIQSIGVQIREHLIDKSGWYEVYDKFPITRSGAMQYKKCFNIPKQDGTTDYIEVKVNDDGSLDRNEALYISSSGTKKLSKSETYKYFSEETWVVWNIPKKYQKYKVPF